MLHNSWKVAKLWGVTDVGQRAAEDVKEGAWMGTKKTRHGGNKDSEWRECWGWVERNRDSAKVRTRLVPVCVVRPQGGGT